MKKYELTEDTIVDYGVTLHRVRYLSDIPKHEIKKGDLGGYVQSELNLSQEGLCHVKGNAIITGNAVVSEDAMIVGNAWIGDNANISGNVRISHSATVRGDAVIRGNAHIWGRAVVAGSSVIEGKVTAYNDAHIAHDKEPDVPHQAHLSDDVIIYGNATISGQAILNGRVIVCEKAKVTERAFVEGGVHITGESIVSGDAHVSENAKISKNSHISGSCVINGDSSISDALVSGRARIKHSKLIGSINVTDDGLVVSTTLKGDILIKDQATVRGSRLVGNMTLRDKVLLKDVELNGKNILFQGEAYVYMVELKEGKDIEIRDKAKLTYLAIGKLETAWIGESAVLQGKSKAERNTIASTNLTIGGNALVDNYVFISGDDIILYDDAHIIGRVTIGNRVTMKELSSVANRNPLPHYFQLENVKMAMDNNIAL